MDKASALKACLCGERVRPKTYPDGAYLMYDDNIIVLDFYKGLISRISGSTHSAQET